MVQAINSSRTNVLVSKNNSETKTKVEASGRNYIDNPNARNAFIYKAISGESLWSIAGKLTGKGINHDKLIVLRGDLSSRNVRAGDLVFIPAEVALPNLKQTAISENSLLKRSNFEQSIQALHMAFGEEIIDHATYFQCLKDLATKLFPEVNSLKDKIAMIANTDYSLKPKLIELIKTSFQVNSCFGTAHTVYLDAHRSSFAKGKIPSEITKYAIPIPGSEYLVNLKITPEQLKEIEYNPNIKYTSPEAKVEFLEFLAKYTNPAIYITSGYGIYRQAGGKETGGIAHAGIHLGADMTQYKGAPLYASADGIAILKSDSRSGYHIVISTSDNTEYLYMHLAKPPKELWDKFVKGSPVKKGELIGFEGNTGKSTGPHLHFEIRKINAGNPTVSVNPIAGIINSGTFDMIKTALCEVKKPKLKLTDAIYTEQIIAVINKKDPYEELRKQLKPRVKPTPDNPLSIRF